MSAMDLRRRFFLAPPNIRSGVSRVTRRLGLWPVVPDAGTSETGNSEAGDSVKGMRSDVAGLKMQRRRMSFNARLATRQHGRRCRNRLESARALLLGD